MMWMVYYKPTGEAIACRYVIPNLFSQSRKRKWKGMWKTVSFYDWVVHPDHRRAGITMLMYDIRQHSLCHLRVLANG